MRNTDPQLKRVIFIFLTSLGPLQMARNGCPGIPHGQLGALNSIAELAH